MLFLSKQTIVNGIAGRCYLCSQNKLAECAGSNQPDSFIYINVLQYYTEPCNGQCILFRNTDHSIIRGCSWTYGYMTPKSIGWHEISPGIKVYFCNSHLCNNGTYERPEISMINKQFILSPQKLFVLAGNNPSLVSNAIDGRSFERVAGAGFINLTKQLISVGATLGTSITASKLLPHPSIHYIDLQLYLHVFTLACQAYDYETQHAINIRSFVDKILEDFGLYLNVCSIMTTIAQRVLGIPATNTSAKRLFSDSENTITSRCTHLQTSIVNQLLFIHRNL
ncbi:unnamed protein product [Rotaria sordida]|uniref:HAT C-terminal dimerisation domain-containing protein n=1 Tax=Rotaria sordida TaxID=392033 RepID=A0A819N6X7_9BILA|nr:unnamed protein product [Rotaria sordida]